MFRAKLVNRLPFLCSSILLDVPHAFFTRKGGHSLGSNSSLNCSFKSADETCHVEANRDLIMRTLNIQKACYLSQIHSDIVVEANAHSVPMQADGLITNQKNIALIILHADCQAALFYDPCVPAIAAVHCGWKGQVQHIYEKTVQELQKRYGCEPKNIRVAISPSLGPTASEFKDYPNYFPSYFEAFKIGSCHFDLWKLSEFQLMQAGILKEHIDIAGLCTYTNSDDFFSYRKDKLSGRLASVITLC
jgi:YfiH family protein